MLPLKEATSEKHKKAEKMPFNVRMFQGMLSKDEYLLYLYQQLLIFQTIENIGIPHHDLARTKSIQTDIEELNSQGIYTGSILKSTNTYTDYLKSLNYQQLLPHIYMNYLALMFGGQIIKKSVPSSGAMYSFNNTKEALQSVRNHQKDEWADEVNKGFDYIISIFEELEIECTNRKLLTSK